MPRRSVGTLQRWSRIRKRNGAENRAMTCCLACSESRPVMLTPAIFTPCSIVRRDPTDGATATAANRTSTSASAARFQRAMPTSEAAACFTFLMLRPETLAARFPGLRIHAVGSVREAATSVTRPSPGAARLQSQHPSLEPVGEPTVASTTASPGWFCKRLPDVTSRFIAGMGAGNYGSCDGSPTARGGAKRAAQRAREARKRGRAGRGHAHVAYGSEPIEGCRQATRQVRVGSTPDERSFLDGEPELARELVGPPKSARLRPEAGIGGRPGRSGPSPSIRAGSARASRSRRRPQMLPPVWVHGRRRGRSLPAR